MIVLVPVHFTTEDTAWKGNNGIELLKTSFDRLEAICSPKDILCCSDKKEILHMAAARKWQTMETVCAKDSAPLPHGSVDALQELIAQGHDTDSHVIVYNFRWLTPLPALVRQLVDEKILETQAPTISAAPPVDHPCQLKIDYLLRASGRIFMIENKAPLTDALPNNWNTTSPFPFDWSHWNISPNQPALYVKAEGRGFQRISREKLLPDTSALCWLFVDANTARLAVPPTFSERYKTHILGVGVLGSQSEPIILAQDDDGITVHLPRGTTVQGDLVNLVPIDHEASLFMCKAAQDNTYRLQGRIQNLAGSCFYYLLDVADGPCDIVEPLHCRSEERRVGKEC